MSPPVMGGIAIKRSSVSYGPERLSSVIDAFLSSGLLVLDLRDSWDRLLKKDEILRRIREAKEAVIIGRFIGLYPNFENMINQAYFLRTLLGRPIDVFEVKLPFMLVSFEETLRGIKKALSDGIIESFGLIGWNLRAFKLVQELDLLNRLHHFKIDVNFFRQNEISLAKAISGLNIKVFSSSPLHGGRISERGYRSFLTRLIYRSKFETLRSLSKRLNLSISQVALIWLAHNGISYAPSTSVREHVTEIAESLRGFVGENVWKGVIP